MLNMAKLEVIESLDDNRVKVELNGKIYTRKIKTNFSEQSYIIINKSEYGLFHNYDPFEKFWL